ncbi:MAG: peptide ABC transporter ATP-binding protein [Desulfococcus sp. 4484_241]|nr:MAG: peptide ABC transporter ATP-binding protein [Desulfococcus sp. 4484_241]
MTGTDNRNTDGNTPLLAIRDLVVSFATDEGQRIRAIDGVCLDVKPGEILGIVGESGCGKSVTALSVMRLLPKPAGRIESGRIIFDNIDLAKLAPNRMRAYRGSRISMIFQEPMTALNPVHTVGRQLVEAVLLHKKNIGKKEAMSIAVEMLEMVGIPEPGRRMGEYPHQLSGGMRQRIMIAMALSCGPDLLIADEPTTALDVTVQAQILELIKRMQAGTGMSVIMITHDLGVIAETSSRVCVMYAGRIVETADVKTLFSSPAHPYTRGLLASIPRLGTRRKTRLPVIPGVVPSLSDLPPGCRFQNRCDRVMDICRSVPPEPTVVGTGHTAACHAIGM